MATRPILFHDPRSRGGTTAWMNEELGDACEIRLVDLRAGATQKPDYLELNPMAKIPTLTHGKIVVTEAAAICAYLADAFADKGLAPAPSDPKRGPYYRWMFFAPSVIEPMMLDVLGNVTRENAGAAGHGDPERVMKTINTALSSEPYLLGEQFTAADVVMGSTLRFATMFGAIEKEGAIASYLNRVMDRPAFKTVEAKSAAWMQELGTS